MTSVAAVVLSQGLTPELTATPEWHSVCTRQHNAMLAGPEDATERLLRLLQPHLRTPALWTRAPAPLELPATGRGTLILRNVSALARREQAALLDWLGAGRPQVISTTECPLFPLIACGLFDEALYYRLNVVLLTVDSTGAPAGAEAMR